VTRTTSLALAALAGAGVLVSGATTATADDSPANKPIIAAPKQQPPATASVHTAHPQFFGGFVTVPPGSNLTASVACPAGQVPTGGGGTTSAFKIFFTDSFASGNSWFVRGTNTNTVNESIRAFVVCTTP
jgi:hypothetical protein